jgi:hypothetical protein
MAKTYEGGTQVKSGYYVNARSFAFANIEKAGGKLPGGSKEKFIRVPTLVVMAAAPALGGLFVVALPFLGFGMVAYAAARKLGMGAKEVAATVASPAMPAGSTALTGRPAEKGVTGEPAKHAATEELAKEIEEKRNAKE